MKIYPAPKQRNITLRYGVDVGPTIACRQRKLRRLPHIFAKALELPFGSDADVLIQETSDCFRFAVITDDIGDDIRAHALEIYPGVTKIVIRGTNILDASVDQLAFDFWRFRLPPSTLPESASAEYSDGELVVTVPKDLNHVDFDGDDNGNGNRDGFWGEGNGNMGARRLVLVQ